MISEYQNLINDFRRTLQVFRLKLLFNSLLNAGIIIGGTILFFLFFHYLITLLFQLTVLWKTIYYFLFLLVIVIEIFFFVVFSFYRYFLSSFFSNDLLLKQILKQLPACPDPFISIYNLAFHQDQIKGSAQLKEAAFVQKYNYLKHHDLLISFPGKLLFKKLAIFIVLSFLFSFNLLSLSKIFNDLSDYKTVSFRHEVTFSLLNEHLNVEYGKEFTVKLAVNSDDYAIDHVFICFGGGEFLMNREDSLFIYQFQTVNNNIQFNFKTLDQQSEFYKITVLPSPTIINSQVTCIPPAYTGLKSEILTNTIDFRVLYHSSLKFEFSTEDLDSLYLERNGKFSVISLNNNKSAVLNMLVSESGEYTILGSNAYFQKKDLLNFSVTCIPDLYPGIQVSETKDSLRNSMHYFYGVISDDYGFSALRFTYSADDHQVGTVVSIPFSKQLNTQEFYFSFDFAEFAGMDKSKIQYYFEVFDNDNISGPKSTRSDQKEYQVPDLKTIFDYNVQVNDAVNAALSDVEKLAGEIVSGVKELQKKMLDNTVDNWEKQQLSKDIIEKKDKLDQLLNAVKENNLKKSDLNRSFTAQDSSLFLKQKQIQELLDKVMDDEMKNLMKEFSKLSEEFSKDKFNDLDEKMKLTFDQMSEELDRNIELLKRYQIEERHDLIVKQMDRLGTDQEKLQKMMQNQSISNDSLSTAFKELKENADNVQKNYSDLLKENKKLTDPYSMRDFKPDFDQLSQEIDKQQQEIENGQRDQDLSDQIEKKIEDLSDQMKEQQKQNFVNKFLPQSDIELIIQNILIISLSEEELLKQFPKVASQSLKYNELGKLQDLKRQEYRIIKDSLSVLAKSNLMLASLLSHKFYDIEIKLGLLSDYIQNNKTADLVREQQYIINYLNDIALSLTEALQKSKQEAKKESAKGSKQGSESGKNDGGTSSGKDNSGYDKMRGYQNGLKKRLEDLLAQMKKGEKGKPLQREISNMIRENELFKKSLNDFISESGSLSNTERHLLNEINQLLEENIKDLANYAVSGQLVNRNNLIYNKLLISEKASKEREELEEKRRSESAFDAQYKHPGVKFDMKKKSTLLKTDFQKSDLKLNDYFKMMYNNYYIKLGNE